MSGPGTLRDLAESYLDLRWHFDPVAASEAGLSAHDGRLGSFARDDVQRQVAALRSIMGAVEGVAVDALDDEIDRTALLNELRFGVHVLEVECPHVRDPGFWLSHVFDGLYRMLAARDRTHAARATAAAARVRAIPAFLEAASATLETPAPVLASLAGDMAAGGRVLLDEIATHFATPDDPTLADVCRDAVAAIDRFSDMLVRDAPDGRQNGYAIGTDAFNFRLAFQHALKPTASELLRYGDALITEVERDLQRRAAEIAPRTPWPDLMDQLREQHPTAEELVGRYTVEMERARAFVAEHDLATIPEGPLDVLATPTFLRPLVPFAAYQPPGAFSQDRSGTFYVSEPGRGNPAEHRRALRDHCVFEIPSTALHEGYPGHHLQFLNTHALARPLRRILNTPVTIEGWALYCEEMMGEQGFYRFAEERFFQRVALLWRAVRIVLDVGLHTGRLTFDDAVRELEHRVHFARSHAEAEVRRYCAEPAYQLAYAVGRRELTALRADFERASGSEYTPRRFHDAVLAYGGLPVSLMRWGLGL